jgi:uncharacterized DUF497 family protein
MIYDDLVFEFDVEKAAQNWREHGVDFEDAALVFADPWRVERRDESAGNASGEERWQTLGLVRKVLFVVYTELGEKTRLISARAASKAEKRSYYGNEDDNHTGWAKAYYGAGKKNQGRGEGPHTLHPGLPRKQSRGVGGIRRESAGTAA